MLRRLQVEGYRLLADLEVEPGPLTVVFGPNGAGKSSLLDTLWFFRDCAARGVEVASTERSHGIGLRWDGAEEGSPIRLAVTTERALYEIRLSFSSGRLDPYPGERLVSLQTGRELVRRPMGTTQAVFAAPPDLQTQSIVLREPDRLSLTPYLNIHPGADEAAEMDALLRSIQMYPCRFFSFHGLKTRGSEGRPGFRLKERADNLWSVLRNLHDRRAADNRYDTLMGYMREAFPSFDGLLFEQTGLTSVTGRFLERGRREPIWASGVADGHLHLLILLTALFAEDRETSVLLLDEPDLSLHPWALAVFARALKAANARGQQIFITTHSPVLLSQFAAEESFAAELKGDRAHLTRLSDAEGLGDLLEQYAAGSLYMANIIAPQGTPGIVEEESGYRNEG